MDDAKKLLTKRLSLILIVILISGSALTVIYIGIVRPRLILGNCRFQMRSLIIHSYDAESVVFKALVEVSNPDWQAAQLDPLTFTVVQASLSEPVAKGWTENTYSIAAHGSATVTLFLQVYDSPALSTTLEELVNAAKVQLIISGSMTCPWLMNLGFPFTFDYVLESERNLLDTIEVVSIKALPPGTIFNAAIRVNNPLNFTFEVSNLVFDVLNESRTYMLSGVLSSPMTISPLASADALVSIGVRKDEFEWLVGELLSDKPVRLSVQGNISAGILSLHVNANLNLSKIFRPSRRMDFKVNTTLLSPIETGSDSVVFRIPIEIGSPIELNLSSIYFELHNSTHYVGFGNAFYEAPLLLSPDRKTQVTVSINMTLSAFRSLVVRVMLGEPVDLRIRHGVVSAFIYQTEYDIRFEKEI